MLALSASQGRLLLRLWLKFFNIYINTNEATNIEASRQRSFFILRMLGGGYDELFIIFALYISKLDYVLCVCVKLGSLLLEHL